MAKKVIQPIEDHDAAKEPPHNLIRIDIILADSEESGLTSKENKRKIKQVIMISQVLTNYPTIEDDLVIWLLEEEPDRGLICCTMTPSSWTSRLCRP